VVDLGEWGHGFVVGGIFGVFWGVMLAVMLFLGAAAMKAEKAAEMPDNVRQLRKRR
jgi:hypothetical protein